MGFYEYIMLDENDQWNELWKNGQFITHYVDSAQKLSLYALHAFFVEIELDLTSNKIVRKEHFVSGYSMDKYSGSIDIDKI